MSYIKDLVRAVGDEAALLSEGTNTGELTGFVDTGSYIVNAVLSGSLYGGIPENKVTIIAGESTTGKTFFCISVAQAFMAKHPDGIVAYFDTESAVTRSMFKSRGVDPDRVIIYEPVTIQEMKHKAWALLSSIEKKGNPVPLMIFIDSVGNLSTEKEIKDVSEASNIKDMTRAAEMKAMIRTVGLKAAKLRIPIIMTNHLYANVGGYGPQKVMGGGKGLYYLSDTIMNLSKRKITEDKEITGNEIDVTMFKSRFSVENKKVTTVLDYKTGLDKHYGLLALIDDLDLLEAVGWGKLGNQYIVNDKKYYGKSIYKDPEKFFTEEVLAEIDKAVATEFTYGTD